MYLAFEKPHISVVNCFHWVVIFRERQRLLVIVNCPIKIFFTPGKVITKAETETKICVTDLLYFVFRSLFH